MAVVEFRGKSGGSIPLLGRDKRYVYGENIKVTDAQLEALIKGKAEVVQLYKRDKEDKGEKQ